MRAVDILRKKRNGQELSGEEIRWLAARNLTGEVADYQLGAFLMAAFLRGLSRRETADLTRAFMESGRILDFSSLPGPKVDKHSTGGVGDKVSLILAPLAAAVGLRVPMVAGRGLGHTGGTVDKLEAIAGYNPFLPLEDFARIVAEVGCSIIGQTDHFCPADRKWYALRDVTSTVENVELITASIMSKKLAEGIDALVLDVKVGSGAFMESLEDAERLARSLVRVGREMGKPVAAVLTDMNQPLGLEIGNANEVAESIAVLRNRGESRLTELTLILTARMMMLGGLEPDFDRALAVCRRHLENGDAWRKFTALVAAHGGDPELLENPERLPRATHAADFIAPTDGFLTGIRTADLGRAAMALGAGREKAEDPIDFGAGITMHRQIGDRVACGEPLCTMQAGSPERLAAGLAKLAGVFTLAEKAPSPVPLIRQVITDA